MNKIDPNDPAFPLQASDGRGGLLINQGLTKREFAAIEAMSALLSNSAVDHADTTYKETALKSLQYVDALIQELEKSK